MVAYLEKYNRDYGAELEFEILKSEIEVQTSLEKLGLLEQRFFKIRDLVGTPKLREGGSGFKALVKIIVSQQLSVSAADAIWLRITETMKVEPNVISEACDFKLKSLGLSRPKIKYLKLLASENLDFDALSKLGNQDLLSELIKIKGVGLWTAQIYAMFGLRRADIFPIGDLALQEAIRLLYELEKRPIERRMIEISDQWKPYRSVAALILWDYYNYCKGRKGIST